MKPEISSAYVRPDRSSRSGRRRLPYRRRLRHRYARSAASSRLSTGHQPIPNEDRTVWVVYNGEIYNFQQLRRDLIAKGHRFETNSDTETLVHLYEEEGAGGLPRLRGMLVRSNACARPACRSKATRKHSGCIPSSTCIPDPNTAFRAIRKLPPRRVARVFAQGRRERGPLLETAAAPAGVTEEEARRRPRDSFDEAACIRMIANVPLGAFLSGGIGFSSAVASMALPSPEPVKTFSIGFREAAYNELAYASLVARKYRTEHHKIVVQPDSVGLARKAGAPFRRVVRRPLRHSYFHRFGVRRAAFGQGGLERRRRRRDIRRVRELRRHGEMARPRPRAARCRRSAGAPTWHAR